MGALVTARNPSIRISNVGGNVRGSDLVDFARQAGEQPVYVAVVFSSATTATARHGLGRRYVGGMVISATAAHASNIVVATPEVAEAAGIDPAVYVYLLASTSYTGTVTVRMVR